MEPTPYQHRLRPVHGGAIAIDGKATVTTNDGNFSVLKSLLSVPAETAEGILENGNMGHFSDIKGAALDGKATIGTSKRRSQVSSE
jgi:hypothetical protein